MKIAEIIYQYVKAVPDAKAIEILHSVEFIESKSDDVAQDTNQVIAEFMQALPLGNRPDKDIDQYIAALRNEWD